MSITRPPYDEHGGRMASCEVCGMCWVEWRESVELLPGSWTVAGERPHECPEPLRYEDALAMVQTAKACGGIIVSQRQKAAIRLSLEARP